MEGVVPYIHPYWLAQIDTLVPDIDDYPGEWIEVDPDEEFDYESDSGDSSSSNSSSDSSVLTNGSDSWVPMPTDSMGFPMTEDPFTVDATDSGGCKRTGEVEIRLEWEASPEGPVLVVKVRGDVDDWPHQSDPSSFASITGADGSELSEPDLAQLQAMFQALDGYESSSDEDEDDEDDTDEEDEDEDEDDHEPDGDEDDDAGSIMSVSDDGSDLDGAGGYDPFWDDPSPSDSSDPSDDSSESDSDESAEEDEMIRFLEGATDAQKLGPRAHTLFDAEWADHHWLVVRLRNSIKTLSKNFTKHRRVTQQYIWSMPVERVINFLTRLRVILSSVVTYDRFAVAFEGYLHRYIDPIIGVLLEHRTRAPHMSPGTRQVLVGLLEGFAEARVRVRYAFPTGDHWVCAPAKRKWDLETKEGRRRFEQAHPWMSNAVLAASREAQIRRLPRIKVSTKGAYWPAPDEPDGTPSTGPAPPPMPTPAPAAAAAPPPVFPFGPAPSGPFLGASGPSSQARTTLSRDNRYSQRLDITGSPVAGHRAGRAAVQSSLGKRKRG